MQSHGKIGVKVGFVESNGGLVFLFLLFVTAALCSLYYVLGAGNYLSFPALIGDAPDEDLIAFYRASELLKLGQAAVAYDLDQFRAPMSEISQKLMFRNPPHFFLFIAPLAYVDYGTAKAIVMILVTLALLAIGLMTNQKPLLLILLLLSGAAFYDITVLNVSVLPIAAIVFALLHSDRYPVLAGLALAFATTKPQYGLLVPVYLLVCGQWRAILWTVVFCAVIAVLTSLLAGWGIWQAYLSAMNSPAYTDYAAYVAPGNLSIQSAAGKLGFDPDQRYILQGLFALCGAGLIWFARRRFTKNGLVAITLLCAAIAAPHLLFYSWSLLCAGILLLVKEKVPLPAVMQVLAGLLWSQPIVATLLFNFAEHVTRPVSLLVTANILAVLLGSTWLLVRAPGKGGV